jgi:DNA-binding MarR family transcriptional regulator
MDNAVNAWASLLKVHATLVPELDRELQQRHQLPLTWYDVLLELNAAPERRLTMGELGQRATVSRTRVSRVVDELSRAGLVTREPHPADKRSAYAVLTQAGRNRLRQAAPTYLAAIRRRFTAHLTTEENTDLAKALQRVLDANG